MNKTTDKYFFAACPGLRRVPLFVLLAALVFSASCTKKAELPGVAATVNGQSISFRELEAARVIRFEGRSRQEQGPDDATLQSQYRHVLRGMIEDLIVCQYMRSKGFNLPEDAVEEEEKRIRADYPEGGFEEMLLEDGVSLDIWREGIKRRLTVELFLNMELRPHITISSEEVQQYYLEHKEDFVIPEKWHFMQLAGPDRKEVAGAQKAFMESGNAEAVQKEFSVSMHDISIGMELLPQEVRAALAPLSPWGGSKLLSANGEFRAFVLKEKIPSVTLDPASISQRVEQALGEEKMRLIYAIWMQRRIAGARVSIAPAMLRDLPASGASAGQASSPPAE